MDVIVSGRSPTLTIFAIILLVTLIGVVILAAPSANDEITYTRTSPTATLTSATRSDQDTQVVGATSTPTPSRPAPTSTATVEPMSIEPDAPANDPSPTIPPPADPAPTAPVARAVEAPFHISIPAIGVSTTVEWVGLDENGDMDVPSGYDTVAWYERGARPGALGNAVIAGHLDSPGGPAIFYRLRDLEPGDEITVTTHDGEELRFVVDRAASFTPDNAPRYEIFGPSSRANLNLITCGGVFDRTTGAYDERLVVYSTLVT